MSSGEPEERPASVSTERERRGGRAIGQRGTTPAARTVLAHDHAEAGSRKVESERAHDAYLAPRLVGVNAGE
jgi:hypothetical protein